MLLRRREVWVPTVWGWLALLALVVAIATALVFGINGFLAPNRPARGPDGSGARTLVVEGWLEASDLDQAIVAFRRGRYARVLTTGGPIDAWSDGGGYQNYAARAAAYLRASGLNEVAVVAVPAPPSLQDRTFLSAVMVRDWAARSNVALDAIDLYSAGVHARRSQLAFGMALGPSTEVGVMASVPREFDSVRWWTSSLGAKAALSEALSYAWTKCCFWPAAPGSHEERWAVPATNRTTNSTSKPTTDPTK